MKKLFLILLFFGNFGFSQKAEVFSFTTTDKTISAGIDDKYDIEIFLKVHKFSNEHANIYSVKGWYWYLNKRVKIPLVGIFDGDLTLFHFVDKKSGNRILELDSQLKEDVYTNIENLKNTTGFEEKLSFNWSNMRVVGQWEKGDKKLPIKTLENSNFDDFQVLRTYEFLRINIVKDKTYDLDLRGLNLFRTEFSLVGTYSSKTENRILLQYEYASKPYAMGMCGAGMEKGYVTLRFDSSYNLVSFDEVAVESCLDNIYSEEDSKDVAVLNVTDRDGKLRKWKVDTKNAKITIVK